MTGSIELECALPGCAKKITNTPATADQRKYCCADHRRAARRQRVQRTPRTGERTGPTTTVASAMVVRDARPVLTPSTPAPRREAGVPAVPARSGRPATSRPYRRLVPEPHRRWSRHQLPRSHPGRGVKPATRHGMPASLLPEWLRPSPARGPGESAADADGWWPSGDWWSCAVGGARRLTRSLVEGARRLLMLLIRVIGLAGASCRGIFRRIPKPGARVAFMVRGQERTAERNMVRAQRRAAAARARQDAAAVLRGTALPGGQRSGRRGAGRLLKSPIELPAPTPPVWAAQARESLLAALHSLSIHRLRSALTAVGIVIGVAAVIVLVALGNGMKANFNTQFSKLANQIIVSPASGAVPDGGVAHKLTDGDVAAMRDPQTAPDIAAISPNVTGSVTLTENQAKDRASLVGATANYLELLDRHMAVGEWFADGQIAGNARVAVLGQQAVNLLWGPDTDLNKVVGSSIRISRNTFKLVGVLASDGQNDNVVMTPLGTARTYLVGNNGGEVDQILVKSTDVTTVDQAATEITAILDARHNIKAAADRDFNVRTFTELLNTSNQFVDFLTAFIVAVAAISLLVGGIGVANIMLVSVTERTREIGIRKAVGAPRRAIMRQFLSEAVMLTGLGGLLGIIFGVGIAVGGGAILPTIVPEFPAPMLTVAPVVIAFAVSLAIGLVAGGYPANRAARLRPIDALRFE